MQVKSTVQTDVEILTDQLYARMETGNPRGAIGILAEIRQLDRKLALELRADILREYGHAL